MLKKGTNATIKMVLHLEKDPKVLMEVGIKIAATCEFLGRRVI